MLREGTTNAAGEVYSRADGCFLPRAEYDRRRWDREERAFMRRANQGELCAPMVICDGMPAVQSQNNGKMYDSKSAIRRHYKEAGVIEVGNDSSLWSGRRKAEPSYMERDARRRDSHRCAAMADAAVETMSDETIKRRRWERTTRDAKLLT